MSREPDAHALADAVPSWAARVLLVGCGESALAEALGRREGLDVLGVEWDTQVAETAKDLLEAVLVGPPASLELPFPAAYIDCIVIAEPDRVPGPPEAVLRNLLPSLHPDGRLLVAAQGASLDLWRSALSSRGMRDYRNPDEPAPLIAVNPAYNPLEHARRLFDAKRPDRSCAILDGVPDGFISESEQILLMEAEKQLALLAADNMLPEERRLERFAKALFSFYLVTSALPDFVHAYVCQAEFWRRIGDVSIAKRLLRGLKAAYPGSEVARALTMYETMPDPAPAVEPLPQPPDASFAPRILFLMSPDKPDCGLDVLWDGLREVLGEKNVVEYPWKPTLHGEASGPHAERCRRYPCFFARSGSRCSEDQILEQLRDGRFDYIVYGDFTRALDRDLVRRILDAAPDTPLVLVDQQDDPVLRFSDTLAYLGRGTALACFKRELLTCVQTPPNVYPLPFAYPGSRIPAQTNVPREHGLFWAGHRQFGQRRLHLEHIEKLTGTDLSGGLAPEDYEQHLLHSRVGLCLFGVGFDTIRYWEIPAHGGMLLAERPPTRIPGNFEDGVSAVFFDDAGDLADKLAYYTAHPDEAGAIARAGHMHLIQHHTGAARARQFLGRLRASALAR